MPIKHFWWPCISPAPPTMFTQELSFLEMVGALTEKLNEVITQVNALEKKTLLPKNGVDENDN